MEQTIYLLLDSRGVAIARGRVQGKANGPYWQIQVEDGMIDKVLEHKKLRLLSITDAWPSYEGDIVRSRNDMIQLEVTKLKRDADDMRKNLRVATNFKSLIYPISGYWRGRREIEASDISAGGIAFYATHILEVGERLEVVIPVTSEPMVVQCEVLRMRISERAALLYAAKFADLCDDEETVLREAVFNLQLGGRYR